MPFFFSNTKSLNRGMKPTRFLEENGFLAASLRTCERTEVAGNRTVETPQRGVSTARIPGTGNRPHPKAGFFTPSPSLERSD